MKAVICWNASLILNISDILHLLTYMATIYKLLGTHLVRITVPLGPNDGQPIREIFGELTIDSWIKNVLPKLPTEDGAALSPAEEFDDLLFNFLSSKGN